MEQTACTYRVSHLVSIYAYMTAWYLATATTYIFTSFCSQSYPLASTLKIQAAQDDAENSPAERPQAELSMCNVKLAISLVPRLNERRLSLGMRLQTF